MRSFDDDAELSSGDLALWVADNMEITKHYKIEDNMLNKEGSRLLNFMFLNLRIVITAEVFSYFGCC